MLSETGSYVLILKCSQYKEIVVGKSGRMELEPGFYLYAGSAFGPGGISARVSRHLRTGKNLRWHIDFLREQTHVHAVLLEYSETRREEPWVRHMAECGRFKIPMAGFGSTDSRHRAHLFYTAGTPDLTQLADQLDGNVRVNRCA